MNIHRVCYSSRATSQQPIILEDLREILSEARHFNYLHNITGVLYFADGNFFQCIEGEKDNLNLLIEKLQKDKRHQGLYFYPDKMINHRNFSDWSMKYVSRSSEVKAYFSNSGLNDFNPSLLNEHQVEEMLEILIAADEKTQRSPS